MCNQSGSGTCCNLTQDKMLKVLMEKNKEIDSLKAQVSKLVSDAGWEADYQREQAEARLGDEWK